MQAVGGSAALAAASAAAPLWRALCPGGPASAAMAAALPLCRWLSSVADAASTSGAAAAAEEVPVLIAGGGPTGLTTALLLAKYGIRSVVLERSRTLTDHPQAHFINMRCMEVFRGLGGEA